MAKETLLQKEFAEKDIKRIRNLVSGNYHDATQTQVGYSRKHIERKQGDVWEENGKSWTIKNGVRISVSKLDRAKSYAFMPLLCPECNKPMKTEYDKKMFHIHSTCFNCVIKKETQLKIEGKWEEYALNIMKNNANFTLNEFENGFEDYMNSFDSTGFVTEQGDIEDWHVKALDKQKIREEVMKNLQNARNELNA
jgi:hypothetical protein